MQPNFSLSYPGAIAHRCGGVHAPENTLAGLRATAALGIAGVEFDVMLCGDGTPVLIHDETLERTTDGRGAVADIPFAALRRLDAGKGWEARFAGELIPRFAEAAACCREMGLWANVEIKPSAGKDAVTGEVVARLAREFWPDGTGVLFSSFSSVALMEARRVAPELPRALLLERVPADWTRRLDDLGAVALHVDWRSLDEVAVAAVRGAGVPLACYTVNDPAVATRLFDWGVTAVFSDRPERISPQVAGCKAVKQ